jgi:hypothetical protein
MTDLEIAGLVLIAWVNGVFLGYIIWAPLTPFKQGFVDGLSLKFLWRKK